MSTVTQIMISTEGAIGEALKRQLEEQHTQLENIQCALECLARGSEENDLRGTLQLLGNCVGAVKHSIFDISTKLAG